MQGKSPYGANEACRLWCLIVLIKLLCINFLKKIFVTIEYAFGNQLCKVMYIYLLSFYVFDYLLSVLLILFTRCQLHFVQWRGRLFPRHERPFRFISSFFLLLLLPLHLCLKERGGFHGGVFWRCLALRNHLLLPLTRPLWRCRLASPASAPTHPRKGSLCYSLTRPRWSSHFLRSWHANVRYGLHLFSRLSAFTTLYSDIL